MERILLKQYRVANGYIIRVFRRWNESEYNYEVVNFYLRKGLFGGRWEEGCRFCYKLEKGAVKVAKEMALRYLEPYGIEEIKEDIEEIIKTIKP